MIKQSLQRLAFIAAALAPAVLGAQAAAAPASAPSVVTVYRESVKVGKGGAHDAHEEGWAGALIAAKTPATMLAISAMTGPAESWYLSLYPTWAAFEKARTANDANPALSAIDKKFAAMEGEFLSDGRMMVLTSREDLSYGGPADLAASRYMQVTRISVRPGQNAIFEENRKLIKAAHESARLPDRYSMWQAASGAPAGTYFMFVARKSLAEVDESGPMHNGAAYQAALGGADGMKKLNANASAAVMSQQSDLFGFLPQQSIPPAEWVTADPGYWTRKAAPKKQ